uniref:Uncharacterized protein n=1 Tax=Plectus sambesii TaxID=2011161 RepID=A0A914W7T5_9BILA
MGTGQWPPPRLWAARLHLVVEPRALPSYLSLPTPPAPPPIDTPVRSFADDRAASNFSLANTPVHVLPPHRPQHTLYALIIDAVDTDTPVDGATPRFRSRTRIRTPAICDH